MLIRRKEEKGRRTGPVDSTCSDDQEFDGGGFYLFVWGNGFGSFEL